ncbi:hypothetical protein [Paenibacillus sp. N3.4]|uniref:hypothetical protein n=1 Tax=Paenibacillus sp. N3.4 TaxID=2603222 RepID=UPI0011CA90AE|nr:hypothetical protein [Paenibacillus sp. N3.4]TXK84139.1 hypothetical protein FU659_09800 [Paenibacillus sp. N3.4]
MGKWMPLFVLLISFILSSCTSDENDIPSENQAIKVIILQGVQYRVTEETIDVKAIEQKVGQVHSYSNKRGEHYIVDAFSNAFPVGTELYKIKDDQVDLAIAVQTNALYLRAVKR